MSGDRYTRNRSASGSIENNWQAFVSRETYSGGVLVPKPLISKFVFNVEKATACKQKREECSE
jgi:hypothetical protein